MADFDLKVVSWDGHNLNDQTNYTAGFVPANEWGLPAVNPQLVKRDGAWPLVGGVDRPGEVMRIQVHIKGANKRTLRDQLLRWFDPEDETPKKLVVEDEDGAKDRYKYAICQDIQPIPAPQVGSRDAFFILMTTHGDVRWRNVNESQGGWSVTASGQTQAFTNNGTDEAYPIIEIKPTTQKTSEYLYSVPVAISWRSNSPVRNYPVRIGPIDTTDTGRFQANLEDLRVFIDGKEVNRWTYPTVRNANTYIWVNIPFQAGQSDSLITQIPATGTINSIEIGENIYDFPDEGIVRIDNEIFSYTARDLAEEKLVGITRDLWGTSKALHSVGATVWWIQHTVELRYGNPSASAPSVDNDWKPDFSIVSTDSDNTKWKYATFGSMPKDAGEQKAQDNREGVWRNYGEIARIGDPSVVGICYTGQFGTQNLSSYTYIGARIEARTRYSFGWQLWCPCGAVNAEWSGESYAEDTSNWLAETRYLERDTGARRYQYQIPPPTNPATWDTWSKAKDGTDWDPAGDAISLWNFWFKSMVGADGMTVYFDTSEVPAIYLCPEDTDNYPLSVDLENQTTGEIMTVTFNMAINQTLKIDTDNDTVVYLRDSTSQRQAVETDTVRKRWLTFAPGSNTLKFTDPGTVAVTVTVKWRERYY